MPVELAAAIAGDDDRPIARALRALPQLNWRRHALGLLPLLVLVVALGLGEVLLSRPLLSNAGATAPIAAPISGRINNRCTRLRSLTRSS